MYACMRLRLAVEAVLHAALLLHGCDRFYCSTACMYIWAHTSPFSQINSNWTPQLAIWHDIQANCCVSRCFACMHDTLCGWAGSAHLAKVQQVITCSHCSDAQSTSALPYCQCVMQLTGTPDGGCHVEHKLKVQPVLDAPALFSKSALSSCACSCCI